MRRGMAAAAAAVVVALACASPVLAAPPDNPVVTGSISVAMSAGPSNPPLLSGDFQSDDSNGPVTSVTALMSWTGPDPDHHPKFSPQKVCPSAQCMAKDNGFHIDRFPLPTADFNGPYHVDATATATNPVFGTGNGTAKADFAVNVPPPPVTAVTAAIGKDRIVTVSFDRDATTPDVQSYYLYRKGPGDKDFTAIAQTPQLNTGARINVFDDRAQYKGGDYLYQVETHRNGASGDGTTTVVSDKAKSQSNKVTMSDPPPGVTAPPTTTPKGGGPPPVVRGTPSGVTRSSGFSGSSSGSSSGTTPTSEAVTPDPGFVRGLPYAAGSPSPDNGNEGDNSAVAVTPGRHKGAGRGYLVPLAGSAVFVLGALHLRIFKKRLDEPPTTLTPIS